MKNNGATAAVAAKCPVYFCELLFSCYKIFDVRNIGETKDGGKVLAFDPYSG